METFDQNQLRELFRTLRKAKQLKQHRGSWNLNNHRQQL